MREDHYLNWFLLHVSMNFITVIHFFSISPDSCEISTGEVDPFCFLVRFAYYFFLMLSLFTVNNLNTYLENQTSKFFLFFILWKHITYLQKIPNIKKSTNMRHWLLKFHRHINVVILRTLSFNIIWQINPIHDCSVSKSQLKIWLFN